MRLLSVILFFLLFSKAFSGEYVYGNILYMPSHIYGIVVSKSHQKLIVLKIENGYPVVVDEFVSSTGLKFGDKLKKGDMRTPSGVYFPLKFKPDSVLPEYYGAGAFTLNYPNGLDRFVIRRDGDGIWIHGFWEEELLFFSSKGCVILKNSDFKQLSEYITLKKTPVVIQERFFRTSIDEYKNMRRQVNSFINRWIDALYSLYSGKTEKLYTLYSDRFYSSEGTRYDQIHHYKKELYALGGNRPFINTVNKTVLYDIRDDGREFFTVRFLMVYLSGDKVKTVGKVLYLAEENGVLRVISEENI
ncbi:L,D-transpeptidase family protein [Persephonella sp.]